MSHNELEDQYINASQKESEDQFEYVSHLRHEDQIRDVNQLNFEDQMNYVIKMEKGQFKRQNIRRDLISFFRAHKNFFFSTADIAKIFDIKRNTIENHLFHLHYGKVITKLTFKNKKNGQDFYIWGIEGK